MLGFVRELLGPDEPSIGIDVLAKRSILDFIKKNQKRYLQVKSGSAKGEE